MSEVFDPMATASQNVARLVRSEHDGFCTGEPPGITWPGVPSVEDVLARIHVEPGARMTEDEWLAACDALGC